MSNKQAGTDFEKEFCQLVSKAGFWAHMLNANMRGQPADVIIAKNGKTALVDCKDCEHDIFPFSRIEENQELSMKKWLITGNRNAVFVLKVSSGIRVIPFNILNTYKETGDKQFNLAQIHKFGKPLKDWVDEFNAYNNK